MHLPLPSTSTKYCMTYVIAVPAVLARELPPSSPTIPTPNVVALSPRGHRDPSSTSLHTIDKRSGKATRDSSRKSYPSSAIGDAHDHYNHYNNQRRLLGHPPLTPLRTHRARVPTWIGDDFLASCHSLYIRYVHYTLVGRRLLHDAQKYDCIWCHM
ncbi:hypothetical protein B0H34DRAFT_124088 [Crassisporium funariophilum]|nr:hypothetical protein B0H34DRAFT_124088 [Crassisporium funariophilum]